MKTIKEWFESVENPILRKVLLMRYNELRYKTGEPVNIEGLSEALFYCFSFRKSVEGGEFWTKVYLELCNSNESPTFNAKYPVMQIKWLDENECIWCQTEEEANQICQLINYNWLDNKNYILNFDWYNLKSLCYYPKSNSFLPLFASENKKHTIYPAKFFIKDMKQDLLEEAKKRYPIGCKFKSLRNSKNYVVAEGIFYQNSLRGGSILVNHTRKNSDYVYYNNQWAEYVEIFRFKVGDVIEADILDKWSKIDFNYFVKQWGKCNHSIYTDKSIKDIQFIDGHVAFKIDQFDNAWIKAEGLREFIELEKLKQDAAKAEQQFIDCLNEFNQNNMKTQTLTLGQLKDLYHANDCPNWILKISYYLKTNQNWKLKDDFPVVIKQEDIEYAKKHCSKVQLKLLKDAGLKFEEECPYKVGDWVIWKDNLYKIINICNFDERSPYGAGLFIVLNDDANTTISYWKNKDKIRKATEAEIKYAQIEWDKLKTGSVVKLKEFSLYFNFNKPFDVVFYNQPFYINASSMEFGKTESNNYCVIHQNSCYCNLNPSEFKKLITEVISY